MRLPALTVAFAAWLLAAASAIEVSDTVAPGSPLIGTVDGESERSLLLEPVELREGDGGLIVATTRLFRIRGLRYGFVIGVPSGTPPGPYVVRSVGEESTIIVVPREFPRERILLDATLSDLLKEEDPLKEAENTELEALIARFDVQANWHPGPFAMPVARFRRSSPYGEVREYLLADGSTTLGLHRGVDLAVPAGTEVVAPAAGRVMMARARIMTGNSVVIEHLPGVYSLYFHLSELAVSEGDRVAAGARVGSVGATGLATGPHLHWEMRVSGIAVDPEAFVEGAQVPGHVDRTRLAAIMAVSPASNEGR